MKSIFILLISLFLLSGCGSDSTDDKKECSPACNSWETCNTSTKTCEINEGKCNSNTDCTKAGEICNTTIHLCETERTGQQIFQQTCSKCHALPNPENFTKAEIADELNNHKTRGRITLSETDFNKLSEYLNSLAQ